MTGNRRELSLLKTVRFAVCAVFSAAVYIFAQQSGGGLKLIDYIDPVSGRTVKAVKNSILIKFRQENRKSFSGQTGSGLDKEIDSFFKQNSFKLRLGKKELRERTVRPPQQGAFRLFSGGEDPYAKVNSAVRRGRPISFTAEITNMEETVARYSKESFIEYAEPVFLRYPFDLSIDYFGEQWEFKTQGANVIDAWQYQRSSSAVIAVIEAGFKLDHEDFTNIIWTKQYDIRNSSTNVYPYPGSTHGTRVVSMIGAAHGNGGVSGVIKNPVIMPLATSYYTTDYGTAAIDYAVSNGAKVINMSWGAATFSMAEKEAVNRAYNSGVILIAAAGNNGNTRRNYPAAHENVIAVGASDSNRELFGSSTHGDWLDITAPGEDVYVASYDINDTSKDIYLQSSGTSFASPLTAGVAALALAAESSLSPEQFKGVLIGTAFRDPLNPYPRVNAEELLKRFTVDKSSEIIHPAGGLPAVKQQLLIRVWSYGSGFLSNSLSITDAANPTPGDYTELTNTLLSKLGEEMFVVYNSNYNTGSYTLLLITYFDTGGTVTSNTDTAQVEFLQVPVSQLITPATNVVIGTNDVLQIHASGYGDDFWSNVFYVKKVDKGADYNAVPTRYKLTDQITNKYIYRFAGIDHAAGSYDFTFETHYNSTNSPITTTRTIHVVENFGGEIVYPDRSPFYLSNGEQLDVRIKAEGRASEYSLSFFPKGGVLGGGSEIKSGVSPTVAAAVVTVKPEDYPSGRYTLLLEVKYSLDPPFSYNLRREKDIEIINSANQPTAEIVSPPENALLMTRLEVNITGWGPNFSSNLLEIGSGADPADYTQLPALSADRTEEITNELFAVLSNSDFTPGVHTLRLRSFFLENGAATNITNLRRINAAPPPVSRSSPRLLRQKRLCLPTISTLRFQATEPPSFRISF